MRNAYTFEEKGAILTQSVRNGFFLKKSQQKFVCFREMHYFCSRIVIKKQKIDMIRIANNWWWRNSRFKRS